MRHYRVEKSFAVGRRDPEMESRSTPKETAKLLVETPDNRCQALILLKSVIRRPQPIALGEDGFRGLTAPGCYDFAKQLRTKGNCSIPSTARWHKKEAHLSNEPGGKKGSSFLDEDITHGLVIVEIAEGFDL